MTDSLMKRVLPSHAFRLVLTVCSVLAGGLLFASTQAFASNGYKQKPGSSESFPPAPTGVAVDNSGTSSAGNVYVVDGTTIYQFLAGGAFLDKVLLPDRDKADRVAVDSSGRASAGDVHVTVPADGAIHKLGGGSGSTFVEGLASPTGIAVDVAGNVYVAQRGLGNILEFSSSGAPLNAGKPVVEGLTEPEGIAIDSNGDLYVADESEPGTLEFTPTGTGGFSAPKTIESAPAFDVAVDSSTGDVFVAGGETVDVFDSSGNQIGVALGSENVILNNYKAVAVSGATGDVYAINTHDDALDEAEPEAHTAGGWSILSTPNPIGATESVLGGPFSAGGTHISCSSSTECTAVGFYKNSSDTDVTLAERWNGTEWSVQSTPNPAGATASYFHGVSCWSATACTAVGFYKTTSSQGNWLPLAERWNGAEWSIQAVPAPTGSIETFLEDVSCSSSTACTAVGEYRASLETYRVTWAARWNGTEWSVQSTPNPVEQTESRLEGVSCSSSTACIAVGQYRKNSEPENKHLSFAERWNGIEWLLESTPSPAGVTQSWLGAVSCSSSTACTAVGEYENSSRRKVTLVDRWNGTEWALQSTPNPTGSTASLLAGVSCSLAAACTAVGWEKNSFGTYVTLAERWNGAEWKVQFTPNPIGATEGELSGVSCATACIAVGWDKNSWDTAVTLAELEGGEPTGEAPAIGSESVAGVTEHDATLEAQINPDGLETEYESVLEYALCQKSEVRCDLWVSAPVGHGEIAAGDEAVTVSADLTSLKPNYAYIYRVVATNSAGTTKGQTQAFKTVPGNIIEPLPSAPSGGDQPSAPGSGDQPAGSPMLPSSAPATVDSSSSPVHTTTKSEVTGNALKLERALKMCEKRAKRQRASCKKRAHKRYATTAKKTNKKASGSSRTERR